MNETETITGGTVKPFGQRIAVVDPPADKQTSSGLYLPEGADQVAVGIVVANPAAEDPFHSFMGEMYQQEIKSLKPGCKVYYHKGHGIEIKDTRILDVSCVIAYEEI